MLDVPEGSIYYWMYTQGLKHVPYATIIRAVSSAGKIIREKDEQNYWNGWHNSDLYQGKARDSMWMLTRRTRPEPVQSEYFTKGYSDYPKHPYMEYPEVENRWVPCNQANKPMIKWGEGCMTLADAKAMSKQVYLAENLKGTKTIVIDCDGDHEDKLDMQTIAHLWRYADKTHCLMKPKKIWEYNGYETVGVEIPASFHLTFTTDKVIPTFHFPYAHIDIAGNMRNQLRYLKNKEWNGVQPAPMTEEIWNEIKKYIRFRKEKADGISV